MTTEASNNTNKATTNNPGNNKNNNNNNSDKPTTSTTAETDTDGDVKMKDASNSGNTNNAASTVSETINGSTEKKKDTAAATATAAASSANNPPPPVMRGTLSYNEESRKHIMRGMWNYENSTVFPSQRFELLRTLQPDEDLEQLPADGEFHGSFSLAYLHTTSKGKQKERSKVVQEQGVKIKFVPMPGNPRCFTMTGRGTNQFGVFHINGTAKPSDHEGDPVMHVEFPDPKNEKGMLSKFEYEHKSMMSSAAFPVSGKYSGWFEVMTEDGTRTRINESNVTLKFHKNNAGYFNVDGKGSNVYGKYSITGTMTKDNVITIFRHFQPRKIKAPKNVTPPPPPINSSQPAMRRASSAAIIANPQLKMEDAELPPEASDENKPLKPMEQPANATYSAVSRGVLRINEDGSHSCTGKWAVTREHFTSGQTSSFTVRLDSHYAKEALAADDSRQFPLDSAMYKGSFQLKKTAGRYQTIVDDQVVMRFRKNSAGSYNVYGKGVNAIGIFNLSGTLIMNGKTGGQVELYRTYPPALLKPAANPAADAVSSGAGGAAVDAATVAAASKSSVKPNFPPPPAKGLQRRESTRQIKLPSRLEDDDPSAQLNRIMDRCNQMIRTMREKDVASGGFFSSPVDPVALGIPTYLQIIKEPMDLGTIARRMELNEMESPEEFARLCRLVFENAMKFNVDPAHSVHQAARNLLIQFNQKFRDIERMIQNFRRTQGDDKKDPKKGKKKEPVKPKTIREIRYEEAQAMATESAEAMANLVAAAPGNSASVSRTEFSMLLRMIQQMQNNMAQTYRLLASLSPDEVEAQPSLPDPMASSVSMSAFVPAVAAAAPRPAPATERKKPQKRKAEVIEEPAVLPDVPLTREEQELLTETINDLPAEHLGGVIQIIREAAPVGADEDEIDLDIDQLSYSTQRKLLHHVSKFVKKPKKPAKKAKTSATEKKGKGGSRRSTPVPTPAPAPPRPPAPAPASQPASKQPSTSDLFGLDEKDSDSDSSDPEDNKTPAPAPAPAAAATKGGTTKAQSAKPSQPAGGKEFKLGNPLDALAGDDDGDDDSDDDEDGEIGFNTSSWTLPKTEDSSKSKATALDSDDWAAARKSAEERKAFEEQRKAREEKMKAEAEEQKKQRLLDAAQRGEEIRAQRQEEEAREAAL
eukprot:scaffold2417_cov155-Amphora_coffeaeformis.AAC.6